MYKLEAAEKIIESIARQYGLNRYKAELEIEMQKAIKRIKDYLRMTPQPNK